MFPPGCALRASWSVHPPGFASIIVAHSVLVHRSEWSLFRWLRRFPADRVFVDEFSCIGCRNCNNVCPKTFTMEEEYGRARVMVQDADTEAKLQVGCL